MANKRHLEQYDEQGNRIPIYLNDDEVMSGGTTLGERLYDIEGSIGDTPAGAAVLNENSGRLSHDKAPVVVLRYIHQNGTDGMSLDDLNAGDVYADAGGSLELIVIKDGSKTVKNIGIIDKGLIFYSIREQGFYRYLGSAAWELLSQGGGEEQEGTFAELDVDSRLKHIQSPVMVLDCISQSEEPGIADCPIGGYYCYMGNQASACRIRYRKAKVTAGQYEDIDLSSPQGHVLYYNKPEDKTYHWDGQKLVAVLWHAGLAIDNRLMSSRATAVVLRYISANLDDGETPMGANSGDVYCDSNNHIIVRGGTVNPDKEYVTAASLPTTPDADLGLPDQKLVYYDVNKKGFYRWNGVEWKKALDIDIDTTNLVTITQLNNTLSSYATKSELNGKQDKLTGSDVLATINSTQVHYGESVNVIGQKGEKGDKGDTGNVQVDGNGNVLIYNGLDMRQTGAALDAYQGYVLALTKGTFAQAWVKSQFVTVPFCWVLSDTIDGDTILKPIWHIGNGQFVDAVGAEITVDGIAANVPTFSQGGGEVTGGTQITITPSTGALLFVAINNLSPTVSETAQTITINQASMVIDAWCATYGGQSSHVTNTYTAAAPSEPTFNPSTDGAAIRNMALTVTPANGCELHYKINDGSEQTSQGALSTTILAEDYIYKIEAWSYDSSTQMQSAHVTKTYTIARPNAPTMPDSGTVERGASITIGRNNASGSIKYKVGSATPLTVEGDTATVQLTTHQSTIEAWVELNGETSEHVTRNYTMAALNPPVFSPSGGEVLEGAQVTISAAQGAIIKYTTDGSTPTALSPSYQGPITVNASMTIKAYASDNYGNSAVASATYTVKEDAFVVDIAVTESETPTKKMKVTYKTGASTTAEKTFDLDSTTHPVINGVEDTTSYRNTFPYSSSFDGIVDKTITDFKFLSEDGTTENNSTVKRISNGGGIITKKTRIIDGNKHEYTLLSEAEINIDYTAADNQIEYLARYLPNNLKLTVSGKCAGLYNAFATYNNAHTLDVDITGLKPINENGFSTVYGIIDGKGTTLRIGKDFKVASGTNVSSFIINQNNVGYLSNLYLPSVPPELGDSVADWFGGLAQKIATDGVSSKRKFTVHIKRSSWVTYKNAAGWSGYIPDYDSSKTEVNTTVESTTTAGQIVTITWKFYE